MKLTLPQWHVDQTALLSRARELCESDQATSHTAALRKAFKAVATACMYRNRVAHQFEIKHRRENQRSTAHAERDELSRRLIQERTDRSPRLLTNLQHALERIAQLERLPSDTPDRQRSLDINRGILNDIRTECVRLGIPLEEEAADMTVA